MHKILVGIVISIATLSGCVSLRETLAANAAEEQLVDEYVFTMSEFETKGFVIEYFKSAGYSINESQSTVNATIRADKMKQKLTATIQPVTASTSTMRLFFKQRPLNSTGAWTEDKAEAMRVKKEMIQKLDPKFHAEVSQVREDAKKKAKLVEQ